MLRSILLLNGFIDVGGARTTSAAGAAFMMNTSWLLNERVSNDDANLFLIDFASNDVLGLVKFDLTTELFVVGWKVSKRGLSSDIPYIT